MQTDFLLTPHIPLDRTKNQKVRKEIGAHYTPQILADFVAQQVVNAILPQIDGKTIRVLDPSVGDGELLFSLVKEIRAKNNYEIEINGFDTDISAVNAAKKRLQNLFPDFCVSIREEDFTSFSLEHKAEGSLFPLPKYDVVIANPPYVRTQVLGAIQSQELARTFGLSGRVDLYHVFIAGIAAVLRPDGLAGIIVSNRFMTTRGGAEIRRKIQEEFEILHVFDLGDTQIFEAAVLPAVLILRKKGAVKQLVPSKFSSIYRFDEQVPEFHDIDVIEALARDGVTTVADQCYQVQHGNLDIVSNSGGIWRIATKKSDSWLSKVESHTYCTFGDVGKIRVGVKTTADKIFIHSNWTSLPVKERPEVLKPLITHHIARSYRSHPITSSILYTHEIKNGKRVPIDLKLFPVTSAYLETHRATLESREYVTNSGREWFEIWVPQDPASWTRPKIVFRDIASTPTFWIDLSGAVVNGDCYWLMNDYAESDDLLWLALAIGNSTFIESFYDHSFNNKLYSGRRRFMTQYVEKFPLPSPFSRLPREIIVKTKLLFNEISSPDSEKLGKEIDHLVWQSFGFGFEEVTG